MLGRDLQAVKQSIEDIRSLDHVAHEQEQRHRDQHVVRHDAEGALDEELEDVVAHRVVAEEHGERDQCEGDRKAQKDRDDEHAHHQDADLGIGHCFSPWCSTSCRISAAVLPACASSRITFSSSSTSRRRCGVFPVRSVTTQRMTSTVPCSSMKIAANGMTALKG